jgi:hypothetical protein
MTQFPAFAPISNMTWGLDLVRPMFHRGWFPSRSSADGYTSQTTDLFDLHGARVAAGRQTIAIFV